MLSPDTKKRHAEETPKIIKNICKGISYGRLLEMGFSSTLVARLYGTTLRKIKRET